MLRYKTPPGEDRIRITLEDMPDVLRARQAIYLGRVAANEVASKKVAPEDIPIIKLAESADQLPLPPLGFQMSQLLVNGLHRVIEHNIDDEQHDLHPFIAYTLLRSFDLESTLPKPPADRVIVPDFATSIALTDQRTHKN